MTRRAPKLPYSSLRQSELLGRGRVPSVVLVDPKYARNVGVALRAASCYGAEQVWFSGQRVRLDIAGRSRLPREERMKGFRDVEVLHADRPLDAFEDAVPVAVEVRAAAEPLFDFVHPERAVYVFGPEDGTLPRGIIRRCHRFVVIPTRHCLNLAVSVATVLYDRALKQALAGAPGPRVDPVAWEGRCSKRPLPPRP